MDLKDAGITDAPPKTLLEALLAFQKDATGLKLGKDATNPHFKSKYLTLEKLHDQVMPLLTKHGLVWITKPEVQEDEAVLVYALVMPGSDDTVTGKIPLLRPADMQKLGSAITYARRYALLSVLGLVADEDDDGEAASMPQAAKSTPMPPRKPLKLDKAEGGALMKELAKSPVTIAEAFEHADIKPNEGITPEQALKIRQLIKTRGEHDNA